MIRSLQPRSKTLKDMAADARFYYVDVVTYDPKAAGKFLRKEAIAPLKQLLAVLQQIDRFTEENLEAAFRAVMAKTGLKLGKIAQPVRVALTGRSASPGIFEITEIIGKQRVLQRLQRAVEHIENLT